MWELPYDDVEVFKFIKFSFYYCRGIIVWLETLKVELITLVGEWIFCSRSLFENKTTGDSILPNKGIVVPYHVDACLFQITEMCIYDHPKPPIRLIWGRVFDIERSDQTSCQETGAFVRCHASTNQRRVLFAAHTAITAYGWPLHAQAATQQRAKADRAAQPRTTTAVVLITSLRLVLTRGYVRSRCVRLLLAA
jgi:hypothetical protein